MPPQQEGSATDNNSPVKLRSSWSKEEEEEEDYEEDVESAPLTTLPPLLPHHHHHHDENDDDNNNGHREHHDQKYSLHACILLARRYLLLLGNIAAWYTTNGMNGISMQSFAAKVTAAMTDPNDNDSSSSSNWTSSLQVMYTKGMVTVLVTALQLLLGALLGRCMLHLYRRFFLSSSVSAANGGSSGSSSSTSASPSKQPPPLRSYHHYNNNKTQTLLAALHAAGSVCTNLGFMNGKASLVQVIKLLEPFETLLFTKLLIREEGDLFTTGVVSSMCLTLGAALSLLPNKKQQQQSGSTSYQAAILFAILSGLSLSLRNVLQRRQHAASSSSSTSTAGKEATTTSTDNSNNVSQIKDKLERALALFTQISWHSGRLLLLLSTSLLVLGVPFFFRNQQQHPLSILRGDDGGSSSLLDIGLLSWHPLYNAFSMITLGFCSAVTHSLLNAGKRVYAIVMAIVWFQEGFSTRTAAGLVLVLTGGCWYTVEMKQQQKAKATTTTTTSTTTVNKMTTNPNTNHQSLSVWATTTKKFPFWFKPLLVLLLLQIQWTVFSSSSQT